MFIVEHMLLRFPERARSEVDVEKQAWACKLCWLEPQSFPNITLQLAGRQQGSSGFTLTPVKTSLSPSTTQSRTN